MLETTDSYTMIDFIIDLVFETFLTEKNARDLKSGSLQTRLTGVQEFLVSIVIRYASHKDFLFPPGTVDRLKVLMPFTDKTLPMQSFRSDL